MPLCNRGQLLAEKGDDLEIGKGSKSEFKIRVPDLKSGRRFGEFRYHCMHLCVLNLCANR